MSHPLSFLVILSFLSIQARYLFFIPWWTCYPLLISGLVWITLVFQVSLTAGAGTRCMSLLSSSPNLFFLSLFLYNMRLMHLIIQHYLSFFFLYCHLLDQLQDIKKEKDNKVIPDPIDDRKYWNSWVFYLSNSHY